MKPSALSPCLLGLAAALLALASPLSAVETSLTTNAVSLEHLVTEALNDNPELAFYRAEIDAAKSGQRTAAAYPNPDISFEVGQKRVSDTRGTLLGEGVAWSVTLAQPLEFPGRLALRKAIAGRQIELAELGLGQFRATLAARTRELGFHLLIAEQRSRAAREVAARGRELLAVLVQRDPAGTTPLLETRVIEANVLTLERRASQADEAVQEALLELNQLRGRPYTNALRLLPAPPVFAEPPALEALLTRAATNNYELRQRQAELQQQGFQVTLAQQERWPKVTVSPFYSRERANDDQTIVGVGVSLPLPLWNQNRAPVEIAAARRQQAETTLVVAQRDVERQLTRHYLAYRTKLAEMARWRSDAAEQFRDAAELGDRHYRLGSLPVGTYLELQKQYLEAVDALLDTQAEALDHRQQLELLTGLPLSTVQP